MTMTRRLPTLFTLFIAVILASVEAQGLNRPGADIVYTPCQSTIRSSVDGSGSTKEDRHGRLLKQTENGLECNELHGHYSSETATWNVTDEVLEKTALQSVIECAVDNDVILLSANASERIFSERIVIDKSITITSAVRQPDGQTERNSPKYALTCPSGTEGFFVIRSGDVELANIVIRDCDLHEQASPVTVIGCNSTLTLTHVEFRNNQNDDGPATLGFEDPTCNSAVMTDVLFRNNRGQNSGIAQLARSTTMEQVRVNGNCGSSFVFGMPKESHVTVLATEATGNEVTIFHVQNSILSVTDSNFGQNGGTEVDGAVLNAVDNSEIIISNSTFTGNEGRGGGAVRAVLSDAKISDSRFTDNSASQGGSCFFENVTLSVTNSTFRKNHAADDGGAIHIDSSSLDVSGSVFRRNHARNSGGCLQVYEGESRIVDTSFADNTAMFGAAIKSERADLTGNHLVFSNNHANNTGGACNFDQNWLTLKNSIFERNSAVYGGGFYAQSSNSCVIHNTIFMENEGTHTGGGAQFDLGNVSLLNLTLTRNSAPLGGGFFFFHANVSASELVMKNNAAYEGAAFLSSGSNITISTREEYKRITGLTKIGRSQMHSFGIRASRNVGANGGGALELEDTVINISSSAFVNNRGQEGGGIHVWKTNCTVTIQDTLFRHNSAENGGSIYARALARGDITLKLVNVDFNRSRAEAGGGAVHLTSVESTFENCSFSACTAKEGGAIYARRSLDHWEITERTTSLEECTFNNCTAQTSGGAVFASHVDLRIISCVFNMSNVTHGTGGALACEKMNLYLESTTLKENHASRGGGIHADQLRAFVISHSDFIGNTADEGAGLYANNVSWIASWYSRFVRNSAKKIDGSGGGVTLAEGSEFHGKEIEFNGNSAENGAGVNSDESSRILCVQCLFTGNRATGLGGGIRIDSSHDSGIAAQFDETTFKNNRADFGAAIHFLKTSESQGSWESISAALCGGIVIVNSSFDGNVARTQGHSLHSNGRRNIFVHCHNDDMHKNYWNFVKESELVKLDSAELVRTSCPSWTDDNETVKAVSSYASRIEVEANETVMAKIGDGYVLKDFVAGRELPDIGLVACDVYNQCNASSIDGVLRATLHAPPDLLNGAVSTKMLGAVGNFTGLRTLNTKKAGNYTMEISFNTDTLSNITIYVHVRECRIGEMTTDDGVRCKPCLLEYNFDQNGTCQPCPKHADCSGSFLLPKKGYWNSDPCHDHVTKCLNKDACKGKKANSPVDGFSRSDALHSFTSKLDEEYDSERKCPMRDEQRETYRELLCNNGYTGVLCGSCSASYGKTANFRCEKCLTVGAYIGVLIGALVWIVLVVFITIRGNYVPHRKVLEAVMSIAPRKSAKSIAASQAGSSTDNDEKFVDIELGSKSSEKSYSGVFKDVDVDKQKRAQLAKWKACENIKVFINFLQAIAVAAIVNVEWKESMQDLFWTSDLASGASIGAVSNSVYCLSEGLVERRSVASLKAAILGPFFAVVLFVLYYGLASFWCKHGWRFFIKGSLLSFFVTLYFNYLNVTRQSISVFLCVDVYDNSEYDHSNAYWAQDTAMECHTQEHNSLRFWSVVLLFLVTVSCPLVFALVLFRSYRRGEIEKPGFLFDILGFLYRSYKHPHSYWEAVIMIRKACLSLIAVYSHKYDGTDQVVLASLLLTFCLILQVRVWPYRDEFSRLNWYEFFSLFVSYQTFVLSYYFVPGNASEEFKQCLSYYLVGGILLLTVMFVWSILNGGVQYFYEDLNVRGITDYDPSSSLSIFATWIRCRWKLFEESDSCGSKVAIVLFSTLCKPFLFCAYFNKKGSREKRIKEVEVCRID